MNARVILSPQTAKQNSLTHNILLWMQDHPQFTRNTNCTKLGNMMHIPNYKPRSQAIEVNKMVNNMILFRDGGKKRSSFRINYMHKDIPPDVLERAPFDEQQKVRRALANLNEGQYLNETGCIVTPHKKPEKPTSEVAPDTPTEEESATPAETTPEAKVSMTVQKDGITINLIINTK